MVLVDNFVCGCAVIALNDFRMEFHTVEILPQIGPFLLHLVLDEQKVFRAHVHQHPLSLLGLGLERKDTITQIYSAAAAINSSPGVDSDSTFSSR